MRKLNEFFNNESIDVDNLEELPRDVVNFISNCQHSNSYPTDFITNDNNNYNDNYMIESKGKSISAISKLLSNDKSDIVGFVGKLNDEIVLTVVNVKNHDLRYYVQTSKGSPKRTHYTMADLAYKENKNYKMGYWEDFSNVFSKAELPSIIKDAKSNSLHLIYKV